MEKNNTQNIKLSTLIGRAFHVIFKQVMKHDATYFNLKGGRGSLKSSFISIVIVLLIVQYKDVHAVIYRKTANTLYTSVYAQIQWAITQLQLNSVFKCTKSPLQITNKLTGQMIMFRGLDDAMKSKSIKVPFGYIGINWFEELDEFSGSEEIRKVQQSVLRGGDKFWVFKSMNPPKSRMNWANAYFDKESVRDDTITSETTYLQAPVDWLGQQFIDDAEWLKALDESAYRHEYLGEVVGMGSEVFDNLDIREIPDEELKEFDRIYMGIDWGWYPDPFRWVKMHYDANRRHLYIIDEYSTNKSSNIETANYLIHQKGVRLYDDLLTCDSAEKKSVADYKSYGLNARSAKKGPNSVNEGLKWLQSLITITIDPIRCPHTAQEFKQAEYEVNKDGEVLNSVPDRDNHSIDATRYALERVWMRRGN